MQEWGNRKLRRKNIFLFNVPESKREDGAERMNDDVAISLT